MSGREDAGAKAGRRPVDRPGEGGVRRPGSASGGAAAGTPPHGRASGDSGFIVDPLGNTGAKPLGAIRVDSDSELTRYRTIVLPGKQTESTGARSHRNLMTPLACAARRGVATATGREERPRRPLMGRPTRTSSSCSPRASPSPSATPNSSRASRSRTRAWWRSTPRRTTPCAASPTTSRRRWRGSAPTRTSWRARRRQRLPLSRRQRSKRAPTQARSRGRAERPASPTGGRRSSPSRASASRGWSASS